GITTLTSCDLWQHSDEADQELAPRQVSALGRIEPLSGNIKVSVPSALSNDRVRQILVEEGQEVKAGTPLAILESQTTLSAEVAQSEALIDVARKKLDAQTSVIEEHRAKQVQAEAEAKRARDLYANGAMSASTSEAKVARAAVTTAKLHESIANQSTLKAELEVSLADLEKKKADLALATVKAPIAGTVFKINARAGDKVSEAGILDMGESSRMGVVAEVYQTDRPEIRLGQEATITADGFPDKSAKGKVVEISRQVSTQSVVSGEAGDNVDRRVVEVKIALPQSAITEASMVNNLQVNVLFAPLTEQQRQLRTKS
ncbi:MAG TPA: efflux RND transporter periplasmic adaptor subunit, partial [Prochlorococcaceae cyanobacterium Fu_MAG_50]|nr:efflux RND transporter periplasmic adaptor subunit [Prochlorococcaceae cyanobacterium Fu_MAG_50]